jgi:hypothetical protein
MKIIIGERQIKTNGLSQKKSSSSQEMNRAAQQRRELNRMICFPGLPDVS